MNTNQLSERKRNLNKVKKYFDPNSVSQGGGMIRLFHPIQSPVWMLKDLLPPAPREGEQIQALVEEAAFYAKPVFKQRDEDVPIPNITADVWNTVAVLYAAGRLEQHLKEIVPYLDAVEEMQRMGTRSDYSSLLGVEDPAINTTQNPDALRKPFRITEQEVAEYIMFIQKAEQQLMERYKQKKMGLMQTEQQIQQQRLQQGGEGTAKQLGLDTGQPLPISEYGGATFRHKS